MAGIDDLFKNGLGAGLAVAVIGIDAYRRGFARPHAGLGRQPEGLAGATLWLLPNPSGLNAHYRLGDLVTLYRQLREAVA